MRWLKALLPIMVLALSLVLMVCALCPAATGRGTHTDHAPGTYMVGCLGDLGCEREVGEQYRP